MQHLLDRVPDEDHLREAADAPVIDWCIGFADIMIVVCARLLNWGNYAWPRLILALGNP
jgi:hypothetical protein